MKVTVSLNCSDPESIPIESSIVSSSVDSPNVITFNIISQSKEIYDDLIIKFEAINSIIKVYSIEILACSSPYKKYTFMRLSGKKKNCVIDKTPTPMPSPNRRFEKFSNWNSFEDSESTPMDYYSKPPSGYENLLNGNSFQDLEIKPIQYEPKPASSYENLLEGCKVYVSVQNSSYNRVIKEMSNVLGVEVLGNYSDKANILISDGEDLDLIEIAKINGSIIISPCWLYNCIELREKIDPKIYSII
jgi:hypothetical protein